MKMEIQVQGFKICFDNRTNSTCRKARLPEEVPGLGA